MTQLRKLPTLPAAVARRPYGDTIAVRTAHAIAREDAHHNRVALGIWLALAAIASYLVAVYAIATFALSGWLQP